MQGWAVREGSDFNGGAKGANASNGWQNAFNYRLAAFESMRNFSSPAAICLRPLLTEVAIR